MDAVTYALLNRKIKNYASNVDEWLEENVDPATGYVLDRSLQMENAAAPADLVGDISDTVSDVKNTLNHKADVIYDTASGDIASFPDGADGLPVKDLTVSIEPVQSGTGDPSPTNVRPISGWTGCNVNATGKNICMDTGYRQGVFGWNEEKPVNIYTQEHYISSPLIEVAGGETITITPHGWIVRYYELDKDGNSLFFTGTPLKDSSRTRTLPNNCKYIIFSIGDDNNYYTPSDYGTALYCQIEYGGTATPYEPYSGTTLPISWQSSAGTVYAASLDALAGSLKVRPYYASYNGETLVGPWISSMDAYTPGGTPTTGAQVVDFGGSETSYSLDAIALNTLLGHNNIWADCGPSTVEYPANTKLYIQKINAPSDNDMIADANIASGKYFIVNNNLYISTAAILAGDPIKPGTNCTLTNLAAALNALNS